MKNRERRFIAVILFAIVVMVGFDLFTDASEGVKWWHLLTEAAIALAAAAGIFFLLRGSFVLKQSLEVERK